LSLNRTEQKPRHAVEIGLTACVNPG